MTIRAQASLIQVTSSQPDNRDFGTGFVVHQDGMNTYIVTCAHVVRDVGGPEHVRAGGRSARVVAEGEPDGLDVAVIAVEGLSPITSLALQASSSTSSNVTITGFSEHGRYRTIRALKGKLGKRFEIEDFGHTRRVGAWDFVITDEDNLEKGYSGSPVLDPGTGHVLGVVITKRGEKQGTAISIDTLSKVWATMPTSLIWTDDVTEIALSSSGNDQATVNPIESFPNTDEKDPKSTFDPFLLDSSEAAEARITSKIEAESSFTQDVVRLEAEATNDRIDILSTAVTQLDLFLRSQALPEATQAKSEVESVVEAQIDIARNLVQERHFVAGQAVLIKLKGQYAQNNISPELRARIANLLGCCALGMGEFDVARTRFSEAITDAPKNVGMITNDAMAALLNGKPEEALEISAAARSIDSRNPSAVSVYIQALYRLKQYEELEELLKNEQWIIENAVGAATLASIKYELAEYQQAEVLLRRAIDLDATEPQLYTLLANTILAPLAQELAEAVVFREETNERLKEAEEALSQAVALYEKGDNKDSLHAALVSRAGVRYICGALEAGLTDCERVLGENAQDRGALENKGRILLKLGRNPEAIRCFETILSQPPQDMSKPSRYKISSLGRGGNNVPLLLASAYIDTRQFDKAISLLLPLFTPSSEDREQIDVAELLLVAHAANHNNKAVADIVRIITETWPQDPEAKAVLAEHLA